MIPRPFAQVIMASSFEFMLIVLLGALLFTACNTLLIVDPPTSFACEGELWFGTLCERLRDRLS